MGASTIKLFMNFQNQEDATASRWPLAKTTEWVEQSSYTHRHGRREPVRRESAISVDLLPVNTLMMMKPEEAILQVTGMPLMRIMKLDSGGERMLRSAEIQAGDQAVYGAKSSGRLRQRKVRACFSACLEARKRKIGLPRRLRG